MKTKVTEKKVSEVVVNISEPGDSNYTSVSADVLWEDGKLTYVVIKQSPISMITITPSKLHQFYELTDALKGVTNNPPVGCEPI